MKRTKQRADRAGQAKPEHTSGCRQFEGEDLSKWTYQREFNIYNGVFVVRQCTMKEWCWMLKTSATGLTSKCVKNAHKKPLMMKKRKTMLLSKRPFCGCAACSKMNVIRQRLHMHSRLWERTSRWPYRSVSERKLGLLIKKHRTKLRSLWPTITRCLN